MLTWENSLSQISRMRVTSLALGSLQPKTQEVTRGLETSEREFPMRASLQSYNRIESCRCELNLLRLSFFSLVFSKRVVFLLTVRFFLLTVGLGCLW